MKAECFIVRRSFLLLMKDISAGGLGEVDRLEELGGLKEVEGRAIIPDPDFEVLERIEGRFFGAVGALFPLASIFRAGAVYENYHNCRFSRLFRDLMPTGRIEGGTIEVGAFEEVRS